MTLVFGVFVWLCGVELVRKNTRNTFHLPKGMLLQIIAFVLIYLTLDGSGITLLYAHDHGDFISKGMSIISGQNMKLFQSPDGRSLIHRLAGPAFGLLFVIHSIYLWRHQDFLQRIRWNRDDTQAFLDELRFRTPQSNNWKQKGTYWAILCLSVIMLITGIVQWGAFWLMRYLPFKVVRFTDIIHEWNGRLLTMWIYGILIGYFGILRPLLRRFGHHRNQLAVGVLLVLMIGTSAVAQVERSKIPQSGVEAENQFTSAKQCRTCHTKIYSEWQQSFHSQSIHTPTFKAMLTIFNYNTQGKHLDFCFKCHAAEVKVAKNPVAASEALAQQVLEGKKIQSEGITCTVCHSIEWVLDVPNPEVPVSFDIGKTPPYHKVKKTSVFEQQELCGSCHDYNNPNFPHPENSSTPCCDVNRDWKQTSFAKKGITCQSCHMGDFMGVVEREKGQKFKDALFEVTGLMRYRDDRNRVSHLFPGGRSEDMLKKAVKMHIESNQENDEVKSAVLIENLAGHSIPNG